MFGYDHAARKLINVLMLFLLSLAVSIGTGLGQESAEELFERAAREVERTDFDRAAQLYRQLYETYSKHKLAKEALYWEAFARYRLDKDRELERAVEVLERLQTDFPQAEIIAEAEELAIRIQGKLAERGDPEAARRVYVLAGELAARNAEREKKREYEDECKDDVRVAALSALLHMDSDKARPLLHKILMRRDKCPELRLHALFILSQGDAEENQDLLFEVLNNDPNAEVRAQALFWLGQIPNDRTLDIIEDVLSKSKDEDLMENALFALSQQESRRSKEILRRLASDEKLSSETREMAIFWIGQRADDDDIAFLKQLYRDLDSFESKEKILHAISQIEGQDSMRWLMSIARDRNESMRIRTQAVFWAGQMGKISPDEIYELYKEVDSQEMCEQLAFVLSRQDDPKAVETMMRIAREEDNNELKANLIFWLGQTDDPRVLDFLEEIINQ